MENDDDNSPASQEVKLLKARCGMLEELVSHLQQDNTRMRMQQNDLKEIFEKEKTTLQRELDSVNNELRSIRSRDSAIHIATPETTIESRQRTASEESATDLPAPSNAKVGTDKGFEDWLRRDLPARPRPHSLRGRVGVSQASDLPLIESSTPHSSESPKTPSPVIGFTPVNRPQPASGKSSGLKRPRDPVVKREECDTSLADIHPCISSKRVRKGIVSTGLRAIKRKNPDLYTDNPPTPFEERSTKRHRAPVNYDEYELESAGDLAEEAWREDSAIRSSSRPSAEDPDYIPQSEPERSIAPSLDITIDSSPKTSRYKKRPGNEQERWAKGKSVTANFRFAWKAKTVRELYTEWYEGANGNPSIDSLEKAHGAGWRNYPGKEHNGYANDWINKRRKVIKALDYFAEKQGKDPYALAGEWDEVVRGRMIQLGRILPAPTMFERMKETIQDPLVYFAALPKKPTAGHKERG